MIRLVIFDFFGVIYLPGGVIDKDVLTFILELKKKYKTALLTNVHGVGRYIDRGLLEQYFDLVAPSDEIDLMKPNLGAFEYVLDYFHISPGDAVLVDDIDDYGEAAESLGLQFIHYQSLEQTKADLWKYL